MAGQPRGQQSASQIQRTAQQASQAKIQQSASDLPRALIVAPTAPTTQAYFRRASATADQLKAVQQQTFEDSRAGELAYKAALAAFTKAHPDPMSTSVAVAYPLTPGTVAAGTKGACDLCGKGGHFARKCTNKRLPESERNYRRAMRTAHLAPKVIERLHMLTEGERVSLVDNLQYMTESEQPLEQSFGLGW